MAKELKNYATLDFKKYNFDIIDYEDRREMEEVLIEYACKINEPSIDESEVLMEQFNILKSRRLPAKDWLVRTIYELSKKEKGKQCIKYMIGIIRNRINYGWGTSRSSEEQLITQKVELMIGRIPSVNFMEHIYEFMGKYGSTRIAFAIHKVDMEEILLKRLEEELIKQFPSKIEE
jgi:hypothetical protein